MTPIQGFTQSKIEKAISGTASLVFANAKVSLTLRVDDTLCEIKNQRVQLNVPHDPHQDHCGLIRVLETRSVFHEHLAVSRCKLGWSLHGRVCHGDISRSSNFLLKEHLDSTTELDSLVAFHFELEGIQQPEPTTSDDLLAKTIFDTTCRDVGTGWEIGLPWKPGIRNFPSGRPAAFHRLHLLGSRLDKDESYAKKHYKEMDRLIVEGFAELVSDLGTTIRLWYLPHFGVIKRGTKVRLVLDAGSQSDCTLLNSLLVTGPDYLKPLVGVLMRFRKHLFAVIADIKDMFMRVRVREEDLDAQRFLWRGRDRVSKPTQYRMKILLFGAKSSPSTAAYVKNISTLSFSTSYARYAPKASSKLINNCYVDDVLDSCESKLELIELI